MEKLREIIQEKLEDHIFDRREVAEIQGRLPKLLTTLRALHSIAEAIVHRIRIDQLTKEKRLNKNAEQLFFGSKYLSISKVLKKSYQFLKNSKILPTYLAVPEAQTYVQ